MDKIALAISLTALILGSVALITTYAIYQNQGENYQALSYAYLLQNQGVKVALVPSLKDVASLNPEVNPLQIPANYSITSIQQQGLWKWFLWDVNRYNASQVYFSWNDGQYIFAFLHLNPTYRGVDVISYCNQGFL